MGRSLKYTQLESIPEPLLVVRIHDEACSTRYMREYVTDEIREIRAMNLSHLLDLPEDGVGNLDALFDPSLEQWDVVLGLYRHFVIKWPDAAKDYYINKFVLDRFAVCHAGMRLRCVLNTWKAMGTVKNCDILLKMLMFPFNQRSVLENRQKL